MPGSTEQRTETCHANLGFMSTAWKRRLGGNPYCNQDHSSVSNSIIRSMILSMILSMIHTMSISLQQQTLVYDLDNTTTLSDSSSIVVHDLVLRLATCACSSLLHPQPLVHTTNHNSSVSCSKSSSTQQHDHHCSHLSLPVS